MTLAIFNGSPRRQSSNSTILTNHFLSGYRSKNADGDVKTAYLADVSQMQEHINVFEQATEVIIIFPLYTDCMPGVVKEFFENIPSFSGTSKKIGFIVQSGFPEPFHSVHVERYLEKLVKRLGFTYLGTVIKGGVEGIQVMPPSMTRKLFENFRKLGEHFAAEGEFSEEIMQKFRKPLRMSPIRLLVFRLMQKTGLGNFYWNSLLKKNGAFHQRFDRPLV
jgi:FMN-dependent NADH-azoreductase